MPYHGRAGSERAATGGLLPQPNPRPCTQPVHIGAVLPFRRAGILLLILGPRSRTSSQPFCDHHCSLRACTTGMETLHIGRERWCNVIADCYAVTFTHPALRSLLCGPAAEVAVDMGPLTPCPASPHPPFHGAALIPLCSGPSMWHGHVAGSAAEVKLELSSRGSNGQVGAHCFPTPS